MNKNEFIEAIVARTGSSKVDTSRAVALLTEIISETL